MRRKRACLALTVVALILTWVLPAVAADNPFVIKSPPFKSAIIKYKYTGTQQGTATVYYQGDLRAEHEHTATKVMGIGSENNTITITEPQRITEVNLDEKKAFYTGNYMTYMAQEYDKLSPAEQKQVRKNAKDLGGDVMAAMGGKPQVRQGRFMNRPVEITTVMGMTSYTWKDKHILLKQEGSIMGMKMNMVATDIRTNVPVPAAKLQVPPGIKAVFNKEADQQQRQMAKQFMAKLKDPNFAKKQSQALGQAQAARQQAAQEQAAQPQEAAHQAQQSAPAQGSTQKQADKSASDQGSALDQAGEAVQEGLNSVKKLLNW